MPEENLKSLEQIRLENADNALMEKDYKIARELLEQLGMKIR